MSEDSMPPDPNKIASALLYTSQIQQTLGHLRQTKMEEGQSAEQQIDEFFNRQNQKMVDLKAACVQEVQNKVNRQHTDLGNIQKECSELEVQLQSANNTVVEQKALLTTLANSSNRWTKRQEVGTVVVQQLEQAIQLDSTLREATAAGLFSIVYVGRYQPRVAGSTQASHRPAFVAPAATLTSPMGEGETNSCQFQAPGAPNEQHCSISHSGFGSAGMNGQTAAGGHVPITATNTDSSATKQQMSNAFANGYATPTTQEQVLHPLPQSSAQAMSPLTSSAVCSYSPQTTQMGQQQHAQDHASLHVFPELVRGPVIERNYGFGAAAVVSTRSPDISPSATASVSVTPQQVSAPAPTQSALAPIPSMVSPPVTAATQHAPQQTVASRAALVGSVPVRAMNGLGSPMPMPSSPVMPGPSTSRSGLGVGAPSVAAFRPNLFHARVPLATPLQSALSVSVFKSQSCVVSPGPSSVCGDQGVSAGTDSRSVCAADEERCASVASSVSVQGYMNNVPRPTAAAAMMTTTDYVKCSVDRRPNLLVDFMQASKKNGVKAKFLAEARGLNQPIGCNFDELTKRWLICDTNANQVHVYEYNGSHALQLRHTISKGVNGAHLIKPSVICYSNDFQSFAVKDDYKITVFSAATFEPTAVVHQTDASHRPRAKLMCLSAVYDQHTFGKELFVTLTDAFGGNKAKLSLIDPDTCALMVDAHGAPKEYKYEPGKSIRPGGTKPRFMDWHSSGKLVISDLGNDCNSVYITSQLDGSVLDTIGGPTARHKGSAPGQLNFPSGVRFDCVGNLLVGDAKNNRVQIFDECGVFKCVLQIEQDNGRYTPFTSFPSDLHLTWADPGHVMIMSRQLGTCRLYELQPQ